MDTYFLLQCSLCGTQSRTQSGHITYFFTNTRNQCALCETQSRTQGRTQGRTQSGHIFLITHTPDQCSLCGTQSRTQGRTQSDHIFLITHTPNQCGTKDLQALHVSKHSRVEQSEGNSLEALLSSYIPTEEFEIE